MPGWDFDGPAYFQASTASSPAVPPFATARSACSMPALAHDEGDSVFGRWRRARRRTLAIVSISVLLAGAITIMTRGRPINRVHDGAHPWRAASGASSLETVVMAEAITSSVPNYIKWSADSDKCLDVLGGYTKNGNAVQLWDCNDHPDMQFLVPSQGTGLIQWAKHPEFCLDAPGATKVILWHCDSGNRQHMLFTMPPERKGSIRLASHLDSCLGVPPDASNGDWLVLSSCSSLDTQHLEFTIDDSVALTRKPWRDPLKGIDIVDSTQKAMIQWSYKSSKCFDVVGGYAKNGNAVQIWDCNNHPDMQFLVPSSGIGYIKWAQHPELCLDAPSGDKIIMWNCQEGQKRHMLFAVPKGNAGVIQLAARPDKCLGIPPDKTENGVWIQLWPCHRQEAQMAMWSSLCSWGEWSSLSACSESCGGGVRTRHRKARQKGYKWGGSSFVTMLEEECEGPSTESITCNTNQCPTKAPSRPASPSKDSCAAYGCRSIIPGQSCQCHESCREVGSCCLDFEDVCSATRAASSKIGGGGQGLGRPTTTVAAAAPPTVQKKLGSGGAQVSAEHGRATVQDHPTGGGRVSVARLDQQESIWQAWRLHPRSFATAFSVTFLLFLPVCCWCIPMVLRNTKRRELLHYKPAKSQVDSSMGPKGSPRSPRDNGEEDLDGFCQVRFPEPEDSD